MFITVTPPVSPVPSNMFLSNDQASAQRAIRYVQHRLLTDIDNRTNLEQRPGLVSRLVENPAHVEKPDQHLSEGPVIVYGRCLQAYACVQGLLDMALPGVRIVMLHPMRTPRDGPEDNLTEEEKRKRDKARVKPKCLNLGDVSNALAPVTLHYQNQNT